MERDHLMNQAMSCDDIRTAVSARLDGEEPGLAPRVIDEHIAGCMACRRYVARAGALHRAARVAPAEEVPDLTPAIRAAIAAGGERRAVADRQWPLRLALAIVALIEIAAAIPVLVSGSDVGLSVHAARHLGSFDVALAVGFFFVAWRPARAMGLLPVVAALVACIVGTAVLDAFAGRTDALAEAHHATEIAGLALIWLLGRVAPTPVTPAARYPLTA